VELHLVGGTQITNVGGMQQRTAGFAGHDNCGLSEGLRLPEMLRHLGEDAVSQARKVWRSVSMPSLIHATTYMVQVLFYFTFFFSEIEKILFYIFTFTHHFYTLFGTLPFFLVAYFFICFYSFLHI